MERSTVKTMLLIAGSAIAGILIFIGAMYGYVIYKFYSHEALPDVSTSRYARERGKTVSVPPEIKERFLGSAGSYRTRPPDRDRTLAIGLGRISGKVSSSGKPVQGLRLRLALNGSVMSEWAETDPTGRYAVQVPYGKYRVDGYELDYQSVDSALSGKTDSPQNQPAGSDDIMIVAEGKPGRGVDLEYVDPVRLKGPRGDVSLSKPVILDWEAYPGAVDYEIQVTEQRDASDYGSRRQLFACCDRPRASGTTFELSASGATLTKARVYFVNVTALDAQGKRLAESARMQTRPDFSTTD